MQRRFACVSVPLFIVSLLATYAVPALCQGIETYALVHPFGLSTATTTRQFGMGGPVSCVWDKSSGNPAFAAAHSQPDAGVRLSTTGFDNGPRLTSEHAWFVTPLREDNSGIQVSLFSLSSNTGLVTSPIPSNDMTVNMSEEDASIHYGRRLGSRLLGGIGLSPYSRIKLKLAVPGGPTLLDVHAKPDFGARAGFAYQWGAADSHDYLGLVYDYYQETADATGLLVGGSAEEVFHTDFLALGASRHLRSDLLAVAEYQRGSSHRGAYDGALQGWHFGAEYLPRPGGPRASASMTATAHLGSATKKATGKLTTHS
jgi:hypothetical protein